MRTVTQTVSCSDNGHSRDHQITTTWAACRRGNHILQRKTVPEPQAWETDTPRVCDNETQSHLPPEPSRSGSSRLRGCEHHLSAMGGAAGLDGPARLLPKDRPGEGHSPHDGQPGDGEHEGGLVVINHVLGQVPAVQGPGRGHSEEGRAWVRLASTPGGHRKVTRAP